jgi:hypothetical protein
MVGLGDVGCRRILATRFLFLSVTWNGRGFGEMAGMKDLRLASPR